MGALTWFSEHWFELSQTLGIIAGLFFSVHAMRRDELSRRISNLNAVKQDYLQIWSKLYERPELVRVLDDSVDLATHPVTTAERVFVKQLIVHLDGIHRAMKAGLFVTLEGLQKDVQKFFRSPIAKSVWEEFRSLQDKDIVAFIETSMK